ncbi:MAG TPA: Hsp70 family protein, partial [Pseudonocardia sp.]|nr:Hsp70 family protein [Pseudonocardia sp.]
MTSWVLGVDLGTSYSAGAVAVDDSVELLEVGGDRRVPSTVLLDVGGRLLAGPYAQRAIGRLPERAERNPKRYVGRAPMLLGGEPVTAVDALAALLELFVNEARRRHDGTEPARVVVTHPVAWTDGQRAELNEAAARVLPRTEVALLDEPVAAAVHYVHEGGWAGATGDRTGQVAVYDLGGGTFDTAVVAADRGGFRVVGRPGGDPDIGGEAFDRLVYGHFGAQLEHTAPEWWEQVRSNPERRWLTAAADLLTEARIAKESLSAYEVASQYVPGADADVHLTRTELDELIGADVRRTARLLAETIEAAAGDLRGVFLTGGASRIPLVERTLRETYDGLVRTWQDPKTVVALGAARWAAQRPPGTRPPRRVGPAPAVRAPAPRRPAQPFVTVADAVLDARVTAGGVYTWSIPQGPAGRHRITRRDPTTGRGTGEITFGELAGWAVSDAGMVVAERRAGALRCHTLSPDLTLRSSTGVPTGPDPFLVADGELAWVVLRSPTPRVLVPSEGWGEVGELAVQVLRLGPGPVPPPAPMVAVGPAVYRYVDEDGRQRRLLDPTAPTSSLPAPFGDGMSCAMVIGRLGAEAPRRGQPRAAPRQSLGLFGQAGGFTPIVDQQARESGTPWVHQLLHPTADLPWLLSTSVGLETFDDLRTGAGRRLFLARPPAGAVRWVRAGRRAFGIAVEQLRPGRGLSAHVLVDGRRRELGRWPSL